MTHDNGAHDKCCCGRDYTMSMQLCGDDGTVRSGRFHHGTDYPCTGGAHFAGEHIRCTSPAHSDLPALPGDLLSVLRDQSIIVTSIEAASRAILDAPERPAWHHRGAESREERAERLAAVAVEAVLGVAMPSIRRDAHSEAIAAVEALEPRDFWEEGDWTEEGTPVLPVADVRGVLRGLRDTQAPT